MLIIAQILNIIEHTQFYRIAQVALAVRCKGIDFSPTLLVLAKDRGQVPSLVNAVGPGLLPRLLIAVSNEFVALWKHDASTRCVLQHHTLLQQTKWIL